MIYIVNHPTPKPVPPDCKLLWLFPGEELEGKCECDRCFPPIEKAKALAREYNLPWPGVEEE